MLDIKSIIGLRIRHIRKGQQLSQEDLSLLANLDRTYLNGVENGKRNISIINLDKIIIALNISYQSFFGDDIFNK